MVSSHWIGQWPCGAGIYDTALKPCIERGCLQKVYTKVAIENPHPQHRELLERLAFDQQFNGAMTLLTQHRTIPTGRASIWATEP